MAPRASGRPHFAERFAQALLCERATPTAMPAAHARSCGWFSQSNHPDYRRVRPEALETAVADDGEAADEDGKKSAKATKTPSKEIKIDQIRALADFMNISTHRQRPARGLAVSGRGAERAGRQCAAEDAGRAAAGHGVPAGDAQSRTACCRPSCRAAASSRCACRRSEEALSWLQQQGVADADAWLAEQGGAPLAALAQAGAGRSRDARRLAAAAGASQRRRRAENRGTAAEDPAGGSGRLAAALAV